MFCDKESAQLPRYRPHHKEIRRITAGSAFKGTSLAYTCWEEQPTAANMTFRRCSVVVSVVDTYRSFAGAGIHERFQALRKTKATSSLKMSPLEFIALDFTYNPGATGTTDLKIQLAA